MPRHRSLRVLAVLLLLLVTGCEWIEGLLPSRKKPPLPGERIAVMVNERDLEADPRVADLRVMLPRPYVNAAWPESGGVRSLDITSTSMFCLPSD
jgi:hypothetical protein